MAIAERISCFIALRGAELLSSGAILRKEMALRALGIDEYEKMIECWTKAKLPIKINGRDSRTSIEKQMQKKGVRFIGAFSGAKLVGLTIASYDGRRGWINRLAVLPEFRKRGVASALINEAEDFLKGQGARVIAALIDRSNAPSRGLFERNGYKNEEDILYYAKRESPDA